MRPVLIVLLATLGACRGGTTATTATSTTPTSTTDTGSDLTSPATTDTTPSDTSDTSNTDTEPPDTGAPGDLSCIDSEELLAPGFFSHLWLSPSGEGVGLGSLGSSVRAVDGTWTRDPDLHAPWAARHLDGASIDEVWATNRNHVWRRDAATGMWSDMDFPGEPTYIVGLSVEAPDDVLVITADLQLDSGYQGSGVLTLHSYDGTGWSADLLPVDQAIVQADRLPDGRVVALGYERLEIQNGSTMDPLPVPAGLRAYDLKIAADGAILAMGSDVALGDASGLHLVAPAPAGIQWSLGSIQGVEDVWLVGWGGGGPDGVLTHWDGTTWTHQTVPDFLHVTLMGATGSEVLLSDYSSTGHRIRVADGSGLSTELDQVWLEPLSRLTADDVTAEIWNFGGGGATTFDGTTWVAGSHPFAGMDRGGLVALSSGHGVLTGYATLYFTDGATVTQQPLDWDDAATAVAGSSGTVFALGERWRGATIEGHFGVANDGTGWVPLDLDGLPSSAAIDSAFADAPDDLWIGIGTTTGGALAHYDGTSTTIVDATLPAAPTWIGRSNGGTLWLSLSDRMGGGHGLYSWDGTTMTSVPGLPDDVRSVYELSDGTTYVSTLQETPEGEDLAQVLRSGPKGWEVASEGLDLTLLAGHGDTVVAGRHAGLVAWTGTCTP